MPNKLGLSVITITSIIDQYNPSLLHDIQYNKINSEMRVFVIIITSIIDQHNPPPLHDIQYNKINSENADV
jgi:hypothetical protein